MPEVSASDSWHVEEWNSTHPQWQVLLAVVEQEGQTDWFDAAASQYTWRRGDHTLVARQANEIVGFLRMVTQAIGADEDLPPALYNGQPLIEAKILAFGVVFTHRRQGIGRALQEAAIRLARRLGCYQLKSHSSGASRANHQLKLSLGFAIHRVVRGDDRHGAYFIMPLEKSTNDE